jgi:hypothetical protein
MRCSYQRLGFERRLRGYGAVDLPILVLNDRVPVGSPEYWFDRRWLYRYETVVSLLWKFARVNGVPGLTMMQQLAPHLTDPYEGISPFDAQLQIRPLAKMLNMGTRRVLASLETQAHTAEGFQYCPSCLAAGVHGLMHQRHGSQRCSAHGRALRSRCPRCDVPINYRLTPSLLDAPFACPACNGSLAGKFWSPSRPLQLNLRHRVALTRSWISGS